MTQPTDAPPRVSGKEVGSGGRQASALNHQMTEAPRGKPRSPLHHFPEGTLASRRTRLRGNGCLSS